MRQLHKVNVTIASEGTDGNGAETRCETAVMTTRELASFLKQTEAKLGTVNAKRREEANELRAKLAELETGAEPAM